MENILKVLYDHFYRMPENAPKERRIEANHRLLSQRLSKRNHRLVLQVIDDKDLVCSDVSIDSLALEKVSEERYHTIKPTIRSKIYLRLMIKAFLYPKELMNGLMILIKNMA